MFQNETTNKFSREIALEYLILQLNSNPEKGHYFDLRTEQNQYYCGCRRTPSRVRRDGDLSLAFIRLFLFLRRNTISPILLNMLAMRTRRSVKLCWRTTMRAMKSKASSPSSRRNLKLDLKTSLNSTRSIRSKSSAVDSSALSTEVNLVVIELNSLSIFFFFRSFVGNERTGRDQSDRQESIQRRRREDPS